MTDVREVFTFWPTLFKYTKAVFELAAIAATTIAKDVLYFNA